VPSVLLVEDEFLIRAVLADALGDEGLACIQAPTGQAALDVITSAAPLSAIIVDIGLPDMSGERVIEAAAWHRPGTPIVRCSGRPASWRKSTDAATGTDPVPSLKVNRPPVPLPNSRAT